MREKVSAEEKVRVVLEGLRGEESIAPLCRREGIPSNLYYRWSKEFLEAGKKLLAGDDTKREATSNEVSELRAENEQLKQAVAEMLLKNRFLKKNIERAGFLEQRYMRQSGAEKLETIRLVEQSELSVTATPAPAVRLPDAPGPCRLPVDAPGPECGSSAVSSVVRE